MRRLRGSSTARGRGNASSPNSALGKGAGLSDAGLDDGEILEVVAKVALPNLTKTRSDDRDADGSVDTEDRGGEPGVREAVVVAPVPVVVVREPVVA